MLCYPRLQDVLFFYDEALRRSGGLQGIRELGLIDSALARPRASFGGRQLYRTRWEKAAAMLQSLVKNHGFIDATSGRRGRRSAIFWSETAMPSSHPRVRLSTCCSRSRPVDMTCQISLDGCSIIPDPARDGGRREGSANLARCRSGSAIRRVGPRMKAPSWSGDSGPTT